MGAAPAGSSEESSGAADRPPYLRHSSSQRSVWRCSRPALAAAAISPTLTATPSSHAAGLERLAHHRHQVRPLKRRLAQGPDAEPAARPAVQRRHRRRGVPEGDRAGRRLPGRDGHRHGDGKPRRPSHDAGVAHLLPRRPAQAQATWPGSTSRPGHRSTVHSAVRARSRSARPTRGSTSAFSEHPQHGDGHGAHGQDVGEPSSRPR